MRIRTLVQAVAGAAVLLVGAAAAPAAEYLLRPSENGRFLVRADGTPFFYLGDTAWELLHRATREQADAYLADRAAKGFTVIQTVALAERDGLRRPNPYGHRPLEDGDPARPAVRPGPGNDYWDHVDTIIEKAESLGLYVGLLPTWGRYVTKDCWGKTVDGPFNTSSAEAYGRFIGRRYRAKPIIWILGGDRQSPAEAQKRVWRAMAKGIAVGATGGAHYDRLCMTFHPVGPAASSSYFHGEPWLTFNMIQSSHGPNRENWKMIAHDYGLKPVRPTMDGETSYEEIVFSNRPKCTDYDCRKVAYWGVFAGGFGHTYGAAGLFWFNQPGDGPAFGCNLTWDQAMRLPGSGQMQHLRRLMESRPMLGRVPDQDLLASDAGEGGRHVQATRDAAGRYAFVYVPNAGQAVRVRLDRLAGSDVAAWWFDPRTGRARKAGRFPRRGTKAFTAPAEGPDWVLVLDDAAADFPPPGAARPAK